MVEVIPWHACADTEGRRMYSSEPFATRHKKEAGGQHHASSALPLEKNPVLVGQEAACDLEPVWRALKNSRSPGFDPRTVWPVESRCTDWTIHGRDVSNVVQNHIFHLSVSPILAAWYVVYRRFCITHTAIFDRVLSAGAFLCRQVFHQLNVSEENVWLKRTM
jgi:hypothetical protein